MKSIFTPLNNLMLTVLLGFGMTAFAQPVNDHITNATDLALFTNPFMDEMVDFLSATSTGDGGQQGCSSGVPGIYYKFTPDQTGEITVGVEPFLNPAIVFYSAPNANAQTGQDLTWVDQATNPCEGGNFAGITAEAGTTYYIFVHNETTANVLINLENIFAAPENDYLVNAISLNGLEDYVDTDIHFSMATFTNDFGQSGCNSGEAPAVWYKFTAQIDGQVVAGIGSDPASSAIIFYEAPDETVEQGTELTWVDQPTNSCGMGNIRSIMAETGKTYYLLAAALEPYADVSVNLSGILGTGTIIDTPDLSFYPNPTTSVLNIKSSHTIDSIRLVNMLGQEVLSSRIDATEKTIEVAHLSNGMYIAEVKSGSYSQTFKIIKR